MEQKRRLRLVGLTITAALAFVALVALLEKGPPPLYVFPAASTANLGPLGTYRLLQLLRERYEVTPIFRLSEAGIPKSDVCVYAIISPTEPYTAEEASRIASVLRDSCKRFSVLVADELTTSNEVLRALGSSIRVLGRTIRDANGLPYPTAVLFVSNRSHTLVLDIASEVSGGIAAGYAIDSHSVVASYELLNTTRLCLVAKEGPEYAVLPVGGSKASENAECVYTLGAVDMHSYSMVYVLGDGSVFLNQVIESNETAYRDFVLDLFNHLCFNSDRCRIVIDNSNNVGEDIANSDLYSLLRGRGLSPYEYLQLILTLVARVLHPVFWLPPVVYVLNRLAQSVLEAATLRPLVLMVTVLAVYLWMSRRTPRVRDTRLPEQLEQEHFITADVRKAVASGRVKFDRRDFVNLYDIVDSVLRGVKGVGLGDPRAVEVLRGFLGRDAERFVRNMNRLYAKALKRSFLPIVVSWNRTVKKMLRVCEGVLKALGTSLEGERGVEYVLIRGLISV